MITTTAVTKKKSIKEFYDLDGLELRYPKLSIRIKWLLESVGIEKFIKGYYQDDIAYSELTLLFAPPYHSNRQYITKNITDTPTKKEFIEKLKGYMGYSGYKEFAKNKIPINARIPPRTNIEIGCYIKEQNLIILYFNFFEHADLSVKSAKDNEFINFLIEGITDFVKQNKIIKQDLKEFNKARVIKSFSKNVKNKLEDIKTNIENRKNGIKDYEKSIIDYIKNNTIDEKLVKNLEYLKDNAEDFLFKQIEEIKTLSFVEDIDFTASKGLKVKVTNVKIKYNRIEIPMGNYFLYILPTEIKIIAEKPKKISSYVYHHPHIDGVDGGDCCFGTKRREEIYRLLGNNELKKVVYMLYLFLKSYTSTDKYHNISYWISGTEESEEDEDNDYEEEG